MTILNELPNKAEIVATDNFLASDEQNADAKASAEQLKAYIAPEATPTNAGVVTTETQQFAGNKTLNGSLNVNGEITQNGEPLITDVEISEAEGNAIEKKIDGLYVSKAAAGLPIGTVILNPCEVLPAGFLRCNGETYLKADYPELYAKLPAIYILDENSFKVPDYRDRVPQGANGNLNDLIAAGLPNITGNTAGS